MKNIIDFRTFSKYMCIIDDLVECQPIKYFWYGEKCSIIAEFKHNTYNKSDVLSLIDYLQNEKDFICKNSTSYSITLTDNFLTIIIKYID